MRSVVAEARGPLGNPKEDERKPLEAVIRRLVKIASEGSSLCTSEL